MNELDRNFISALNRKVQKTPPVWIMRQAGRYLPEYRKVRSNFKNFLLIFYGFLIYIFGCFMMDFGLNVLARWRKSQLCWALDTFKNVFDNFF